MTLVLGIAGLLVTALLAAIALAYLARRRIERLATDAAEPLPFPAALRAFLAECVATAITLGSRLFASLPSEAFARPPDGGIAVLVPDVGLDAASFWLLRRRLMRCGWAVWSLVVFMWRFGLGILGFKDGATRRRTRFEQRNGWIRRSGRTVGGGRTWREFSLGGRTKQGTQPDILVSFGRVGWRRPAGKWVAAPLTRSRSRNLSRKRTADTEVRGTMRNEIP